MKPGIFCFLFLFFSFHLRAQEKVPLALVIKTVPDATDDGYYFELPRPHGIAFIQNQTFVCKGVYKSADADTASKGTGVLKNIYENFLGCEIKKSDLLSTVEAGDLCYFLIENKYKRKDVFYKIARYSIGFKSVLDTTIFDAINSLAAWDDSKTNMLLKSLLTDIHFTAGEMLKQNDSQQQTISGGDFNGKDLFTAMKDADEKDLLNFLKYVWAKPAKYAGNTWSISEVFATWMTSGTPKLNGEISN